MPPENETVPDVPALFDAIRRHCAPVYGLHHPPVAVSILLEGIPVSIRLVAPPRVNDVVVHSADFRTVTIGHETYEFTPLQRAAVAALWAAHVAGRPSVPQTEVLRSAGSDQARLVHLFLAPAGGGGKRYHAAWGRLIVPAGKGCYRLDLRQA